MHALRHPTHREALENAHFAITTVKDTVANWRAMLELLERHVVRASPCAGHGPAIAYAGLLNGMGLYNPHALPSMYLHRLVDGIGRELKTDAAIVTKYFLESSVTDGHLYRCENRWFTGTHEQRVAFVVGRVSFRRTNSARGPFEVRLRRSCVHPRLMGTTKRELAEKILAVYGMRFESEVICHEGCAPASRSAAPSRPLTQAKRKGEACFAECAVLLQSCGIEARCWNRLNAFSIVDVGRRVFLYRASCRCPHTWQL
jgi:hypothetical protein